MEHIGPGLAPGRGWDVTVYCRNPRTEAARAYEGTRLVNLPALRLKRWPRRSATPRWSTARAMFSDLDVAIVFSSSNAPFVAPLKCAESGGGARRWFGGRTGQVGRLRAVLRLGPNVPRSLTPMRSSPTRSRSGTTCANNYGRPEYLPYGAPDRQRPGSAAGELIVRRRLPPHRGPLRAQNHVLEIVRGYRASAAELPADRGRRRQLLRLCPGGRTRGLAVTSASNCWARCRTRTARPVVLRCPQRSARAFGRGHEPVVAQGHRELARR